MRLLLSVAPAADGWLPRGCNPNMHTLSPKTTLAAILGASKWPLAVTLPLAVGFLAYQFWPREAGEKKPDSPATFLEDNARGSDNPEMGNPLDRGVSPGQAILPKKPALDSSEVEGNPFKAGQVQAFREGGLEIEMVWCPPDTFLMGSQKSEKKREEDETQHVVTLTKGFWLGRTEVTQAQWKAVMDGANPSRFKGDNLPVETVSWAEVNAFIEKLNKKTEAKYRLPTEAEWEYACRAGTRTPFNTGENLTTDQANYDGNYPYAGPPNGEYREKTLAVGSFEPNAWGLYDMHGNVYEWCSDWYGPYAGRKETDPIGPPTGSRRVFRGGSWIGLARSCRSADRLYGRPGNRGSDLVGFRLLRTPE